MRVLLLLIIFFSINSLQALEIDEKLTLRFLKVSNSKKTILINRGAEDGLAVGDHAKFFVTSGVIARGVVEKVSPSRSVWSLYRVVDPEEITDDKVLNLKIASPVKITVDPTKSMKDEPIPAGSDQMGMEDGSGAESANAISDADQKELEGMGLEERAVSAKKEASAKSKVIEDIPTYSGSSTSKDWEVWGTLYVNSLTGTYEDSAATTENSSAASSSSVDFSVGIEKYFLTQASVLGNTSINIFVHKRALESTGQIKITEDWFEYGGGVNYHFYNSAASTNKLIGFAGINLGAGSAEKNVSSNGADDPVSGSNTFFSGGIGAKYLLTSGFGVRALVDYYSSSETFEYDTGESLTRTLAGPRVLLGISYRF